jgi:hypothetical protein
MNIDLSDLKSNDTISLISKNRHSFINKTFSYADRMILFLSIARFSSTVIDGIQLYDDILINMP